MARNKRGQYVRTGHLEIQITKQLKEIAKEAEVRIRPVVRDAAETILREEIYASYTPATKKGKTVQDYNDTHKHQKSRPYHHTGILASSIYGTIEGDTVKTKVRDTQYPDGASTTKVYDVLKYGTPSESEKKGFYYNNGADFSPYISQEPHNFEARASERIDDFLNELSNNINSETWRKANGMDRYIDKVARKNK